jgi:DNA polymerase-3 subunit delta'
LTGFEDIRDQDRAVGQLTGMIRSGNIPHALLFSGIDGIGKKKTALVFASALNCQHTENRDAVGEKMPVPCKNCRPCKKIASGNHPDVILVEPIKASIGVGQIRELIGLLAVKPYEARHRVAIIDQARSMTAAAGNSLLKLLEEPPGWTSLILVTGNTHDLLPTIVSRCQHIRFSPISEDVLAEFIEKNGLPQDQAAILGRLANGSYARATDLMGSGWIERRKWIVEMLASSGTGGDLHRRTGLLLAAAEKLSRDSQLIGDTLEIMKSWFRDLTVVRNGSHRVVNVDMLTQLKQAAANGSTADFLTRVEIIESAQKKLASNANTRLTLDVMMMKLCT